MHRGSVFGRDRKLGRAKTSGGYPIYSFSVPKEIGDRIPETARFICSINDFGVSFHLLDKRGIKEDMLPQWSVPPSEGVKEGGIIVVDIRDDDEKVPDVNDIDLVEVDEEPRWAVQPEEPEDPNAPVFDWD